MNRVAIIEIFYLKLPLFSLQFQRVSTIWQVPIIQNLTLESFQFWLVVTFDRSSVSGSIWDWVQVFES